MIVRDTHKQEFAAAAVCLDSYLYICVLNMCNCTELQLVVHTCLLLKLRSKVEYMRMFVLPAQHTITQMTNTARSGSHNVPRPAVVLPTRTSRIISISYR